MEEQQQPDQQQEAEITELQQDAVMQTEEAKKPETVEEKGEDAAGEHTRIVSQVSDHQV